MCDHSHLNMRALSPELLVATASTIPLRGAHPCAVVRRVHTATAPPLFAHQLGARALLHLTRCVDLLAGTRAIVWWRSINIVYSVVRSTNRLVGQTRLTSSSHESVRTIQEHIILRAHLAALRRCCVYVSASTRLRCLRRRLSPSSSSSSSAKCYKIHRTCAVQLI